jgi:hypothetical protein
MPSYKTLKNNAYTECEIFDTGCLIYYNHPQNTYLILTQSKNEGISILPDLLKLLINLKTNFYETKKTKKTAFLLYFNKEADGCSFFY